MNTTISKEEYNYINEAVPHSAKNTMIVRLLASESDFSRPYKIDGLEQWVMKAEIASLEIWSKHQRLMWEHTAQWYVSPHTMKLNNLFSKGPAFYPDKGERKSLPTDE